MSSQAKLKAIESILEKKTREKAKKKMESEVKKLEKKMLSFTLRIPGRLAAKIEKAIEMDFTSPSMNSYILQCIAFCTDKIK